MRSITDRIGVNMEKPKVYIDGKEGTTGLQIYERLAGRTDIGLILAEEEKRKDLSERKKLINQADVVFLCLPDAAAAEYASFEYQYKKELQSQFPLLNTE